MTLPVTDRKADARRVLLGMFDALGDRHRTGELVHRRDGDLLAGALPTTVPSLCDLGLVELVPGPGYSLTLDGWVRVVAEFAAPQVRDDYARRRVTLIKTLKRQVDGRQRPAILTTNEIAALAQLPSAWVWHVLNSGWFEMQDAAGRHAVQRGTYGEVIIPLYFGQNPADVL